MHKSCIIVDKRLELLCNQLNYANLTHPAIQEQNPLNGTN